MINYYEFLNESIMNNSSFRQKLLKLAVTGVLATPVITAMLCSPAYSDKEKDEITRVISIEEIIPNYYEQVSSVEDHISRVFSLHNYTLSDLQISPKFLVRLCFEHNYDITLLLAQLQCESLYGTSNLAKETNNPFSINLTDDGKKHYYSSQEDCVISYLELMENYYLVNKDVDDLLKDGEFKNIYGRRYASNPKYERLLRRVRNRIIQDYPVLAESREYSTIYNRYIM